MKPGCADADGVNREERVNYSESKGNHEVDDKEPSVSSSFNFIAQGKFHLSDKLKIEFILNVLIVDELDACRNENSEARFKGCQLIDLAPHTDEKDAGHIGIFRHSGRNGSGMR